MTRTYEVTVTPSSGYINDRPSVERVNAATAAEAIKIVRRQVSMERTRADGPVKYAARLAGDRG
jgi:hypothetical protein